MSMRYRTLRAGTALVLGLFLTPVTGTAGTQRPEREPVPQPTQQAVIIAQDTDARETRERLEELIRRLPPAVGRVLRTDPSLLSNESYLSTFPSLAAFLKAHPEVRTAPNFYFEN